MAYKPLHEFAKERGLSSKSKAVAKKKSYKGDGFTMMMRMPGGALDKHENHTFSNTCPICMSKK